MSCTYVQHWTFHNKNLGDFFLMFTENTQALNETTDFPGKEGVYLFRHMHSIIVASRR